MPFSKNSMGAENGRFGVEEGGRIISVESGGNASAWRLAKTENEKTLWEAAKGGDYKTLKSLLRKGVCPNVYWV